MRAAPAELEARRIATARAALKAAVAAVLADRAAPRVQAEIPVAPGMLESTVSQAPEGPTSGRSLMENIFRQMG